MITQELTAYVKSELNRGKSRDEVRNSLLSGGGCSEADIAEVFRDVMPKDSTAINIPAQGQMQAPSSFIKPTVINKPAHHFPWKAMIFALIFGALCFTGWYYRSSLLSLPDKVISMFNKPEKIASKPVAPVVAPEIPKAPVVLDTINCGTTNSPDRKNMATYINDNVFRCLGESAMVCRNAEAVINDSFFPTIFKITNRNNSCQFSLSYSGTSTLVDVTGKSLAGRSIFCPLSVVKTMDEKDPKNTVFRVENIDNPSKYAKDIYFYGTLGLFIENNFDQMKIDSLGCGGAYVNSVIESYRLMKAN